MQNKENSFPSISHVSENLENSSGVVSAQFVLPCISVPVIIEMSSLCFAFSLFTHVFHGFIIELHSANSLMLMFFFVGCCAGSVCVPVHLYVVVACNLGFSVIFLGHLSAWWPLLCTCQSLSCFIVSLPRAVPFPYVLAWLLGIMCVVDTHFKSWRFHVSLQRIYWSLSHPRASDSVVWHVRLASLVYHDIVMICVSIVSSSSQHCVMPFTHIS